MSEQGPDLDRRRFLLLLTGGGGLLTLLTVGQTVAPLEKVALLAPRLPSNGPQGVPVNTSAKRAGVEEVAQASTWRLEVVGNVREELSLSRADLEKMEQHEERLPIACVEGWSSEGTWGGVRLKDVVTLAGGDLESGVRVESLQEGGAYSTSEVGPTHLRDDLTLLALRLRGEDLHVDHGYPARLIAPGRPGVMQTKWLKRVVVL